MGIIRVLEHLWYQYYLKTNFHYRVDAMTLNVSLEILGYHHGGEERNRIFEMSDTESSISGAFS